MLSLLLRAGLILAIVPWVLSSSAVCAQSAPWELKVSLCDEHCTGMNPERSSCLIDAYALYSYRKPVSDHNHTLLFLVENLFSPGCGTNWTRITTVKAQSVTGSITRLSDGLEYNTLFSNGMGVYWTAMVFAPDKATQACGAAPGASGSAALMYSGCIMG